MKIIKRQILETLLKFSSSYPVITVIGPRQSGKTTLIRDAFKNKPYFNLEDPEKREIIKADPRKFFNDCKDTGAIIDEIQRFPELLSYIQVIVDEKKENGFFIISGSQQFNLLEGITQSLAGRTAILKLMPFSFNEIENYTDIKTDTVILGGGYPKIYSENIDKYYYYQNYIETYIERDLRQLIAIKDLSSFRIFLKLCAGRIGQILNMDSLSNDVGVSSKTIKNWISILETSFILFRLQPFFENRGKRLIKSPKLYFYDTGLACYLLGLENSNQLERDPLRGSLFENLVLTEFIKSDYNKGKNPELYFYRDSNGNEIDIVKYVSRQFQTIEVKSAMTFNKDFLKNIKHFENLYKDRIHSQYLIYNGENLEIKNIKLLNFKNVNDILNDNPM